MTRATVVLLALVLAFAAWGEPQDQPVPFHGAHGACLCRAPHAVAPPHRGVSAGDVDLHGAAALRWSAVESGLTRLPEFRSGASARAGVIPLRI